nr:Chain a, paxillin LD4 [synthetic construct]4XH2_c Chain c, paxillin LD4 [synthetic construct]4XH2_e Chain e, paxillin LD4 [synthetic construct]4XH2_g Chain g, paxillin LD4 [synthetic construct]4XH2_h Chain h, paxillin LD4 [synthetic construct]4XH2_j Chain j, paxillin LD4 [synthetic construct]
WGGSATRELDELMASLSD